MSSNASIVSNNLMIMAINVNSIITNYRRHNLVTFIVEKKTGYYSSK